MATKFDPANPPVEVEQFFAERHLATLTVSRRDGSPQVTPVGVTYDPERQLARVITWADSYKARLVAANPGQRVAVCTVDGGRWLTIYGTAHVTDEPGAVDEAVRKYAARYRPPKERTDRVVIEISVSELVGRA